MSDQEIAPEITPGITPEPTPDWREAVSEDFRADTGLDGIKNVSDLAKGYLSSQRMLGGRIKIPGEGSTDEDREAFNSKLFEVPGVVRIPQEGDTQGFDELYSKLGRPETAKDYSYQTPEDMGRGSEESQIIGDWFKDIAHKSGASNEFVNNVLGGLDQMLINKGAETQKSMDEAETALHHDWGNDYARRMSAGREVVTKYGSEEAKKAIDDSGLGNNPHFNKMMSDIGMNNLEDSAINAGLQQASETAAEIEENLNLEMRKPEYMNGSDPMHKMSVDKVLKLRGRLIEARNAG